MPATRSSAFSQGGVEVSICCRNSSCSTSSAVSFARTADSATAVRWPVEGSTSSSSSSTPILRTDMGPCPPCTARQSLGGARDPGMTTPLLVRSVPRTDLPPEGGGVHTMRAGGRWARCTGTSTSCSCCGPSGSPWSARTPRASSRSPTRRPPRCTAPTRPSCSAATSWSCSSGTVPDRPSTSRRCSPGRPGAATSRCGAPTAPSGSRRCRPPRSAATTAPCPAPWWWPRT